MQHPQADFFKGDSWPAPAKLNLFLHLIGRRDDGYHELQTVFQLIDYADSLRFTPRSDQQIHCTCHSVWDPAAQATTLPSEHNLATKAAQLLQAKSKTPHGVDIQITKQIPIGGGLGGGSSNAATTLLALNYLWQLNLSQAELLRLGLSLGADVPLFIDGHSSWAEGIGEKLHAITLPETWYLVLMPAQSISTAKIFSHPRLTYNTAAIRIQTFLSKHVNTRNDFEDIIRENYPVVAEALDFLNPFAPAHLSGTGACIFSAFDTKSKAECLQEKIKLRYKSFISKGVNTSPLHEKLTNLTQ